MRRTHSALAGAVSLLAACSAELDGAPATENRPEIDAAAPFMPGVVSTPANEYNLSISDDGRVMVFARSEANFERSRILIMHQRDGRWTAPAPISFGDPRYKDSDPWLTPDGQWLYFASDRPAPGRAISRTDRDLWRVEKTGEGRWGEPEHLAQVSSPAEELGPELHGTTLYFNSARPGGPGKLDIYAAPGRPGGGFATPGALGAPINSSSAEGDFTISRDGSRAWFWSTRGGQGQIYVSVRQADGWGEPALLPARINAGGFTFTPSPGRDGRTFFYASTRPRYGQPDGLADIYFTSLF